MLTSFRCGPARAFAVGIKHLLISTMSPALATAFHPFLLILRQTDVIQRLTDEKADSAKKHSKFAILNELSLRALVFLKH